MTLTRYNSAPTSRFLAFTQAMTFTAGQMIWITLYVSVAENLNLSIPQVLVTFAVGSGLYLFGSPFWANKSEIWGRQKILCLSVFVLWLTFASILTLCLFKPNKELAFVLLIIIRSLYGLVAAAIPVVAQALHVDYTDLSSSSKAMLSHSLSLNLGRIVGLVIVLLFSGHLIHSLIFYCILTFIVLTLSFIPILSKNNEAKATPKTLTSSWAEEFIKVRWILALAFIFALFGEALNTSLGPSLKKTLLISSTQTSQTTAYLLFAACMGVALIQLVSRIFIQLGNTLWFFIGFTSLFIGSFLYTNANSLLGFWLAVGFFIVGLGLIPPLYLSYLRSHQDSLNYGKRAGLMSAAHTIGSAFGVGTSTLAFSFYGQQLIGSILMALVILMIFFNWLMHSKK